MNRISIRLALGATMLTTLCLALGATMLTTLCLPGIVPQAAAQSANTASDPPLAIEIAASTRNVNVMGRAKPTIPTMPQLAPKPGLVRGYVKDTQGKPLKGALIGVRSSAIGGAYSGANTKTDAKGYYQIQAPWGAASFYCAGYVADYGDGIAAFGLAPADGNTDSFATTSGEVKNWVLVPYGVADRAGAQDQPQYSGNYYGGQIILTYYVNSDKEAGSKNLPMGATVEVILTPTSPLIDGSKGRVIVLHKNVSESFSDTTYISNIPIAEYKVSAKLVGGSALHMKEIGPYSRNAFGLDPKEADGEASLLLKSYGAEPLYATAGHGHWQQMSISLSLP